MENLNANCGIWLFATRIRLPAHGAERSLATSKSQRVCVCVCGRHPHQCYEFHFVSKTNSSLENLQMASRDELRGRRPKYRAHPPDDRLQKRTIKCASFERDDCWPKLAISPTTANALFGSHPRCVVVERARAEGVRGLRAPLPTSKVAVGVGVN